MRKFKCLVFILFFSTTSLLIFTSYIWNHSSNITRSRSLLKISDYKTTHQYFSKQNKPKLMVNSTCAQYDLKQGASIVANNRCKSIQPSSDTCNIAQNLFSSHRKPNCSHQKKYQICQIKNHGTHHIVKCNADICENGITVGTINHTNGELTWHKEKTAVTLENYIASIIHSLFKSEHYGFCFLKCSSNWHSDKGDTDDDSFVSMDDSDKLQLLLLPVPLKLLGNKKKKHKVRNNYSVNLNIILLDSVSRNHFFRSLPKTVDYFRKMNNNDGDNVLDFINVQAIAPRTFETVNALFSGLVDVDSLPFSVYDLPPKPLNIAALFKPLKQLGYNTLYLEDLCWTWDWGIVKNLLVLNKTLPDRKIWHKLQEALDRAFIDTMGASYSSCEILRSLDYTDPFHGPEAVCYGGHYQHQHLLDYLQSYQGMMYKYKQQYASFFISNIGHDDTGRRIQQLDEGLVEYLSALTRQSANTLTVLLSDHGNAYGDFMERAPVDARMEMFHPFVFIIVPKALSVVLGREKITALIANQNRLISVVDIHQTLKEVYLPRANSQDGYSQANSRANGARSLLHDIPINRTCNDLPHLRNVPTPCICDGHQMSVHVTLEHIVIGEFVLGQLNNHITTQFTSRRSSFDRNTFGNCQRMLGVDITNVQEKTSKGKQGQVKTYSFNLHVVVPAKPNDKHSFFIMVEAYLTPPTYLKLAFYERITLYHQYTKCVDKGLDVTLCICEENELVNSSKPHSKHGDIINTLVGQEVFETFPYVIKVKKKGNKCVVLLGREYDVGIAVEAVNKCDRMISFHLTVISRNMELSVSSNIITEILKPKQIKFLFTALRKIIHIKWHVKFDLNIL